MQRAELKRYSNGAARKPKQKRAIPPNAFKKGERRAGRTKGTPNRTTRLVRESLLMAAHLLGDLSEDMVPQLDREGNPTGRMLVKPKAFGSGGIIGYFCHIGRTNEQLMAELMKQAVLPHEINVNAPDTSHVERDAKQIAADLKRNGIDLRNFTEGPLLELKAVSVEEAASADD